jgi:hypothetical protein
MNRIFVHIKDGEIQNKKVVANAFKLPDGKYQVDIKKAGKRSLNSNAYYWGCVIEYQREGFKGIGYDWSKEQVHEFNKAEFNYTEVINPATGEVKRLPVSTAELSNDQFNNVFLERVKLFCAEWLNTYIPDPSTQTVFSYEA